MTLFLKKLSFFLVLTLFCINVSLAQDSSNTKITDESFFAIAPRIGLGIHNYMNFEVGISALLIDNQILQWGAASAYTTLIVQQTNWNSNLYSPGWKIGIQSSWAIFMYGLEFKTLLIDDKNYNYLSPKIGLSWLDVINIEYALNMIELDKEISINSRHQISINISFVTKNKKKIFQDLK